MKAHDKLQRMAHFFSYQPEEICQKFRSLKDMERVFDACIAEGIESLSWIEKMLKADGCVQEHATKVATTVNLVLKEKYYKIQRQKR